MEPYKPVPVEVARQIAEQYAKSIVIIFAHDPVHGPVHTTTFGTGPQEKEWAAQGGEIATKALGGVTKLSEYSEDYRLQQARKLLAALRLAVHYPHPPKTKTGIAVIDAIHAAIKEAEGFLENEGAPHGSV